MQRYSVNELMSAFRDGLAAVAPILQRVGIEHAVGKAYDEWDRVEQSLLDAVLSLENCEPFVASPKSVLAPYGFGVESYWDASFIGVSHGSLRAAETSLIQMVSRVELFDSVKIQRLDQDMKPIGDTELLPFHNVDFALCISERGKTSVFPELSYH